MNLSIGPGVDIEQLQQATGEPEATEAPAKPPVVCPMPKRKGKEKPEKES